MQPTEGQYRCLISEPMFIHLGNYGMRKPLFISGNVQYIMRDHHHCSDELQFLELIFSKL